MNGAPPSRPGGSEPWPLALLLRTNGLQFWRRAKDIRRQSRLLSSVIGLFILGYLVLAFVLFRQGLDFIANFPGLGSLLTERLFYLLFVFLMVLLLLSNLVVSYTNLFRNRETDFLLALPVAPQTIFRWKFMESTVVASWAFVFLIAPLLAAYGLWQQAPWHFYLAIWGMIALFVVLPAVAGVWISLELALYLDRRSFQALALAAAAAAVVGAFLWWRPEPISEKLLETRVMSVLDRLLDKTRFAQFPFLPSYWLTSGVLRWSEGAVPTAGFFVLVLFSYVLFFGFLTFTKTGRLFYEAASVVHSRGSVLGRWGWFRRRQARRRQFRGTIGWAERPFQWIPGLPLEVRALLVKDVRLFWRDTAQWGQTLLLFGLLGVYIINLRHFSQQLTNPFWVHLVSFLNLGACSLNLATITTRFVYPQFSLEGKRLWIIGMAPLGLVRVLKAKFFLASGLSLLLTLGLTLLSCHILELPAVRTFFFATAITLMTFTLNGLAVGLGALYPNFKEDNPTKIVSGFGGTFCLVLSFLYIVGSVILLAVGSPWWVHRSHRMNGLTAATWVVFVLLSVLLGGIPLRLGLRQAPQLEI